MRFLILLFLALPLRAEETAQFLKIGNGARAIGLGGAYTAVADDLTAMSWNPAGLALLEKRELGGMHADLTAGTHYDFLGYAHPLKGNGTLGGGLVYLGQGSIDSRDASGRLTGGYSASDSALNLAYARRFGSSASLGTNVKVIRSAIGNTTGGTFAFDAGLMKQLDFGFTGIPSVGVAVQNLGPGLKFADQRGTLPVNLAAGAAYRLPVGLTFAADMKYAPSAGSANLSMGTEYALFSGLALRAGYASTHAALSGSTRADDLTGFAAGLGFKFRSLSFDYSVTPFGSLGNAQRFSFSGRF